MNVEAEDDEATNPAAVGRRLTQVCQLDGITISQLAQFGEVSERTARRWLQGL